MSARDDLMTAIVSRSLADTQKVIFELLKRIEALEEKLGHD